MPEQQPDEDKCCGTCDLWTRDTQHTGTCQAWRWVTHESDDCYAWTPKPPKNPEEK